MEDTAADLVVVVGEVAEIGATDAMEDMVVVVDMASTMDATRITNNVQLIDYKPKKL